ncbi:MAG TPA: Uma2 family endonuclease [Gemmatimonadaceae bacterium]|jgi:Uma2 family endonuclease
MAMPAMQRLWSAREVRDLIEKNAFATPRYELVNGELLVTPSPNALHQDAAYLLLRALNDYFKIVPIAHGYTAPLDVDLEPELVVQPDVLVVPMREFERLRREKLPVRELLIAAEILSASSGRFDRVTKREPYQRHVSEYWIVDLDARLFERWLPNDTRPEILARELIWHPSGASEAFRLDLVHYFAECLGE